MYRYIYIYICCLHWE